jgi:hypothetical protein
MVRSEVREKYRDARFGPGSGPSHPLSILSFDGRKARGHFKAVYSHIRQVIGRLDRSLELRGQARIGLSIRKWVSTSLGRKAGDAETRKRFLTI